MDQDITACQERQPPVQYVQLDSPAVPTMLHPPLVPVALTPPLAKHPAQRAQPVSLVTQGPPPAAGQGTTVPPAQAAVFARRVLNVVEAVPPCVAPVTTA